jgi:cytoskeletal protein CcmA (bactofilin family)
MAFRSGKKGEKKDREFTTFEPVQVIEDKSSGSFIGKTMKIVGELISDENLTIEGRVKGSIAVSKTLTIGRYGNVKADINASVVNIIGSARGNIVASDKVAILSDGRYNGNIQSEKLVVAEGAILIGDVNKQKKPKETKKKPSKADKKTAPSPEPEANEEEIKKKEIETGEKEIQAMEAQTPEEPTGPGKADEGKEAEETKKAEAPQ